MKFCTHYIGEPPLEEWILMHIRISTQTNLWPPQTFVNSSQKWNCWLKAPHFNHCWPTLNFEVNHKLQKSIKTDYRSHIHTYKYTYISVWHLSTFPIDICVYKGFTFWLVHLKWPMISNKDCRHCLHIKSWYEYFAQIMVWDLHSMTQGC